VLRYDIGMLLADVFKITISSQDYANIYVTAPISRCVLVHHRFKLRKNPLIVVLGPRSEAPIGCSLPQLGSLQASEPNEQRWL
jgi:hypothetical protein